MTPIGRSGFTRHGFIGPTGVPHVNVATHTAGTATGTPKSYSTFTAWRAEFHVHASVHVAVKPKGEMVGTQPVETISTPLDGMVIVVTVGTASAWRKLPRQAPPQRRVVERPSRRWRL